MYIFTCIFLDIQVQVVNIFAKRNGEKNLVLFIFSKYIILIARSLSLSLSLSLHVSSFLCTLFYNFFLQEFTQTRQIIVINLAIDKDELLRNNVSEYYWNEKPAIRATGFSMTLTTFFTHSLDSFSIFSISQWFNILTISYR